MLDSSDAWDSVSEETEDLRLVVSKPQAAKTEVAIVPSQNPVINCFFCQTIWSVPHCFNIWYKDGLTLAQLLILTMI